LLAELTDVMSDGLAQDLWIVSIASTITLGSQDKIDEYRRNWFSTLAKNATKPNHFEIISLQTARKKHNWKTEETLARTVVTLETERIKGSNP